MGIGMPKRSAQKTPATCGKLASEMGTATATAPERATLHAHTTETGKRRTATGVAPALVRARAGARPLVPAARRVKGGERSRQGC
jgi:hypothetical protein